MAVSMSSGLATPRAAASTAKSMIIATVRATIIPGTSSITLTCLPSAWNSPTASARSAPETVAEAARAIRVAAR